jgi:hypothetical protein
MAFFLGSAKCNEKWYCYGKAQHPFCNPEYYHEKSKNFSKISTKKKA